ncbi:MAG: 3-hydroxyacyl-CoA dehydrogenase family protein, partial [Pseudomonadota bacterium]
VEVVRGAASHQEDIDRACAFVTALGKFPLVVKSAPGFLVNRVLAPYMFEAMQHVARGEAKERVDAAAEAFGMPMGPIELADTVGLDVCMHVAGILGDEATAEGSEFQRLVAQGDLGKKTGKGFYAWSDGKPQKAALNEKNDLESLGRALVQPLITECQRCLDEGIVENADLVDAGVIFGTGFAPFRGGPLHYAEHCTASDRASGDAAPPAQQIAAE